MQALSRAIERDRIGQAYLLVGPRGVGKTSTARIVAKSLNCQQGPTIDPCLECEACRQIEIGGDVDVVEIDGASNNGVDDVRALRDRVHYRPLNDRFKIFIIDEVQRLSGPAFDALLKTLEEPPSHALFLFATTDPHKIPETITSRCQVFEFRRLREQDIQTKLREICRAEEIPVADEVLGALARGCRGGLRDAESMLDQLLAAADQEPTLEDLEMIAGLARPERWLDLIAALERDDAPAILQMVDDFLVRGGTERDFIEQFVDSLRDLLHVRLLGEDALGVEPAPERRQRMMDLSQALGRDRLEALLGLFFQLESRLLQAPLAARALLEWTLLRAARIGDLLETGTLLQNLRQIQNTNGLPVTSSEATRPAASARPVSKAQSTAATARSSSESNSRSAAEHPEKQRSPSPKPDPKESPQDLLRRMLPQRRTLVSTLQKYFLEACFLPDAAAPKGVLLKLRGVSEAEKPLLTDPVELKFLADFPGSPGPWQIEIVGQAAGHEDPLGDRLREAFGGVSEEP